MTSSGPVSVKSRLWRPIWPRSERIELPIPQRSANFISVAAVAGPARPTMTSRSSRARLQLADPGQDRRAFETELRHDVDLDPGRLLPVPPCLKHPESVGGFQKRMALGMAGDADRGDAVGLDQSAGADIAT